MSLRTPCAFRLGSQLFCEPLEERATPAVIGASVPGFAESMSDALVASNSTLATTDIISGRLDVQLQKVRPLASAAPSAPTGEQFLRVDGQHSVNASSIEVLGTAVEQDEKGGGKRGAFSPDISLALNGVQVDATPIAFLDPLNGAESLDKKGGCKKGCEPALISTFASINVAAPQIDVASKVVIW